MKAEEIRIAKDIINKTYGIADEDHETALETNHYLGVIYDLQSQLEKRDKEYLSKLDAIFSALESVNDVTGRWMKELKEEITSKTK